MYNYFIPVKIKNGDKMINITNVIKGIAAAALVFSGIYLPLDYINTPLTYYYEPPTQSEIQSVKEFSGYTVKEYNGKISVFENGSSEPLYSLDSPFVRDLPDYDRELLTKGIKAGSDEELLRILEDYDG